MSRRNIRPAVSLTPRDLQPILTGLRRANAAAARAYPGEPAGRQPVHTMYGGAHLFRADLAPKLGALALAVLEEYAPDAPTLATALGFPAEDPDSEALIDTVRARVVEKLRREPVEDFRIDFEDGYGSRLDDEEDGHALSAAAEVATALTQATLPPFIGIRIKPLSADLHRRGLRTLDLFVTALAREAGDRFPPGFLVTIPKITMPGQVAAAERTCTTLERRLKLPPGILRLEMMIETPQAILGADGTSALRGLVDAGRGRVAGAHFGGYDYTAACGVIAASQRLRHPACDFARHMMQVGLAQTGVRLSDGATTILPVAPHRPAFDRALTPIERRENVSAIHGAWKAHFDDVHHSLVNGYYQGWDLHPAQLPTRYAAVHAFFLSARAAATTRLRNFVDRAAQATLVGDVFDDAATGQGLLNFFVRGLSSGALTTAELLETGLTIEELQGRSFAQILDHRRHHTR